MVTMTRQALFSTTCSSHGVVQSLQGAPRGVVNVLLGQAQGVVDGALALLIVAGAVVVKDPSVQHLDEALLARLERSGIPLLGRLLLDGPGARVGAGDAGCRLENVFLADGEGVDIDDLVAELVQGGTKVEEAVFLDGQTQKGSNSATNLTSEQRII